MRKAIIMAACLAAAAFITGCAGPEQKLGRGMRNMTEFARMGEITRSCEQTALWDGPEVGYTTGFLRGVNKSLVRTVTGVYEVVTFPIPSYGPCFTNYMAPNPVYPDSYKPGLLADPVFSPDNNLGYSGGDVMPFVPGSRFRIFDN
jgi:putative exosortase-associated protein (TIGR04073 family)